MSRIFKYFLLVIVLIASHREAWTQIEEKYEKEIRIKKDEFPQPALHLLMPIMQEDKRSRFYKEINRNSYSFEYKAIYKKEKLSIKFDQEGNLEDIEVRKDFNSLTENLQKEIQRYFNDNFQKYKLKKTQIQYNPPAIKGLKPSEYFNQFLQNDLSNLIIKYEIESEVIDPKKERGYFEFLFNEKGEIEKVKRISERADDNILY